MKNYLKEAIISISLLIPSASYACDLCAIYTSIDSQKTKEGAFRLGLAQQFTEYGKIQNEGKKVNNESHQRMNSSITQILASYDVSNEFGLQLNLPYINRSYKRVTDGTNTESGTEAGLGDLSIIGRYNAINYSEGELIAIGQVILGVKLPTGDSDLLKHESHNDTHDPIIDEEEDHHGMIDAHEGHHHEQIENAVHDHDLALGSGSIDFPIGVNFLLEKGRAFLRGGATYTARTEGDHDYRFADDLMWDFGPGYFVHLDHESFVAARVLLSGEHKGNDKGSDGIHGDTSISTLFLGPQIKARVSESLFIDINWDLPLEIDNSGTQAVASYRLRGGLVYRF